ncbi:MAG: DUF3795 domain-containing protein [Anaerolineae bacterium]
MSVSENHVVADLMGACGLYCGACYHYRAGRPQGRHLLSERARGGRPLTGYVCNGCRSERLYIHSGCQSCNIRACVDRRGLQHCGECEESPCDRLRSFQHDGRKHHLPVVEQLKAATELGMARWLKVQARRWQCASCGTPYSWYEETCPLCGSALASYGRDEPTRS